MLVSRWEKLAHITLPHTLPPPPEHTTLLEENLKLLPPPAYEDMFPLPPPVVEDAPGPQTESAENKTEPKKVSVMAPQSVEAVPGPLT